MHPARCAPPPPPPPPPPFNLAGEMCGSDGYAATAARRESERAAAATVTAVRGGGQLSFLSENVKGEEASERRKRRRERKKERKKEREKALSRWAPCFPLCRHAITDLPCKHSTLSD